MSLTEPKAIRDEYFREDYPRDPGSLYLGPTECDYGANPADWYCKANQIVEAEEHLLGGNPSLEVAYRTITEQQCEVIRARIFSTPAEIAANTVSAQARSRFESLARKWQDETGILSVISKRVLHPAYQQIIGMGELAVPLILEELKRQPDHWFWALHAITGEDPAPEDGNFYDAVAAWLKWGRQRGYIS